MLQHESPGQLTAWPEGNSLWPNQLSGLVCDPRVQGSNPSQVHSVTYISLKDGIFWSMIIFGVIGKIA